MGIVDHHPGAMSLRLGAERRQVGEVAVHAEHAIGDHQGVAAGLFQPLGEAARVVMQITREARAAEQPGIEQGGVIEAIFQHRIALPDQRGHRRQIGHVAGGEQQRTRPAGELGKRLLQLVMRRAVTDHQMRGTAAHAPGRGALLQRRNHLGMVGQAQVVVGAERQQAFTVDRHLRPLRTLQQRTPAVEVLGTTGGEAGREIECHGRNRRR